MCIKLLNVDVNVNVPECTKESIKHGDMFYILLNKLLNTRNSQCYVFRVKFQPTCLRPCNKVFINIAPFQAFNVDDVRCGDFKLF